VLDAYLGDEFWTPWLCSLSFGFQRFCAASIFGTGQPFKCSESCFCRALASSGLGMAGEVFTLHFSSSLSADSSRV
jgi:hypothetical protein